MNARQLPITPAPVDGKIISRFVRATKPASQR
jgi:hypothetical protein